MQVSDEALREGLIYEMMGRIRHEDVRERTVNALCQRFDFDEEHADRVKATALTLYGQLARAWKLMNPDFLGFPDDWLAHHPQTRLELEQEAERLITANVILEVA